MDLKGWNVIDAGAGVLWREYEFTKGAVATTLVFRGAEGLVVVSPPPHLGAADLDALREFGEVRALVANNTLHHLGQASWRAHFKDAVSYCPPGAIANLQKKTGISFRSLAELALPETVRWDDPPGFKTGEAILSIATAKGSLWYTGDLLTNIVKLPRPPLRWMFTLTDSGPGFRLFRPAVWLAVKNQRAVRDWMLARLSKDPPAIVVPAHGAPVEAADVAAQARTQVERL